MGELVESLKIIRQRFLAAKLLYKEARDFGTVEKSLRSINQRLENLDKDIETVKTIHVLADIIARSEIE